MFNKTYQDLINNKNWSALVKEKDFWNSISWLDDINQYTLPEEFWFECFLGELLKTDVLSEYRDDLPSLVLKYISNSGLGTVEFWDRFIKMLLDHEVYKNINSDIYASFFFPIVDLNFLKALLKGDNPYTLELILLSGYSKSFLKNHFKSSFYDALDDKEKEFFKTEFKIPEMPLIFDDLNKIAEMFNQDIPKMYEFNERLCEGDKTWHLVIKPLPKSVIDTKIKEGELDLVKWYSSNLDVEIGDDVLEYIFTQKYNDVIRYFIRNMNKEQLQKYKGKISLYMMAKNTKITLSEIKELYHESILKEYINLNIARFFKEEDIIEHPEFFNPTEVASFVRHYISRKTFRELVAWHDEKNKRIRKTKYNKELSDMKQIVQGMNAHDITFENIEYLMKKTGTSSSELIEMSKYWFKHRDSEFLNTLEQIKKFIKAYE